MSWGQESILVHLFTLVPAESHVWGWGGCFVSAKRPGSASGHSPWGSGISEGAARDQGGGGGGISSQTLFSLRKSTHSLPEAEKPERSPHVSEESSERKPLRNHHAPEAITPCAGCSRWWGGLCPLQSSSGRCLWSEPHCETSPALPDGSWFVGGSTCSRLAGVWSTCCLAVSTASL